MLTKNKSGEYIPGPPLPSPPFCWGRKGSEHRYYYGSRNETNITKTEAKISKVKMTKSGFSAQLKVESVNGVATHINSAENRQAVLQLSAIDMRNTAFCSIPAVKEVFDSFVARFPTPWTGDSDSAARAEQVYVLSNNDLTEKDCKTANALLLKGWEFFTTNKSWPTDLKLKSFSTTVIEGSPFTVTPNKAIFTIPPGRNRESPKNDAKQAFLKPSKGRGNFSINIEFTDLEGCKLGVMIAWSRISVITGYETRQGHRNNTYLAAQNATCWVPEITGFSVIPVPTGAPPCRIAATPGIAPYGVDWERTEYIRVHDQTQKRTAKGGYRGAYQGIKTLAHKGARYCRIYHDNALSGIASGEAISGSTYYKLVGGSRRELPMHIDTYLNLPRPEVDVKPIEIGHLNLYRIAEPPVRRVTADILSDMLLPSMPSLLLAVDSQVRVSSDSDSYVSGGQCYGPCDEAEELDTTLLPGLYTIERREKCSLGHDPGRAEYTHGFGDHCNEIITIRRMLAQLRVHYDEFRGSFVGSKIEPTSARSSSRASGAALLGRLN